MRIRSGSNRITRMGPSEYSAGGSWKVNCMCGVNFDDGQEMVNCDVCGTWVHMLCSRYVRGQKSFACDKCEETEVAQLLVELPTKALKKDSSYHLIDPPRRPTDVQVIPGGGPVPIWVGKRGRGRPSKEMKKCEGTDLKVNRVLNRVKKERSLLGIYSGMGKNEDLGTFNNGSAEKKAKATGKEAIANKRELKVGRPLNSVKKEKILLQTHSGKRRKDDMGISKEGIGKKLSAIDKKVVTKNRDLEESAPKKARTKDNKRDLEVSHPLNSIEKEQSLSWIHSDHKRIEDLGMSKDESGKKDGSGKKVSAIDKEAVTKSRDLEVSCILNNVEERSLLSIRGKRKIEDSVKSKDGSGKKARAIEKEADAKKRGAHAPSIDRGLKTDSKNIKNDRQTLVQKPKPTSKGYLALQNYLEKLKNKLAAGEQHHSEASRLNSSFATGLNDEKVGHQVCARVESSPSGVVDSLIGKEEGVRIAYDKLDDRRGCLSQSVVVVSQKLAPPIKDITLSHIDPHVFPATNTPANVSVPEGQISSNAANESAAHKKRGRPIGSKDLAPRKRSSNRKSYPNNLLEGLINEGSTSSKTPVEVASAELDVKDSHVLQDDMLLSSVHPIVKVALEVDRDNAKEDLDMQSSSRSDVKLNATTRLVPHLGISVDHISGNCEVNDAAVYSLQTDKTNELSGDQSQSKLVLKGLEGSVAMPTSSEPKHDSRQVEGILKLDGTIQSLPALPSQRKMVVCVGKSSSTSSTSVISKSTVTDYGKPANFYIPESIKQQATPSCNTFIKKDRAASDVGKAKDTQERPKTTLKECSKSVVNYDLKELHSSRSLHASVSKQTLLDSKNSVIYTFKSFSEHKIAVNSGPGVSVGSLQGQQNKITSSCLLQRAGKVKQSNGQLSSKVNPILSMHHPASKNSATLSNEKVSRKICKDVPTDGSCSFHEYDDEATRMDKRPLLPDQRRENLVNLEDASARIEAVDESPKPLNSVKNSMPPAFSLTVNRGPSPSIEVTHSSHEFFYETRNMDRWPSSRDQRRDNLENPEDASARKEADDGSPTPVDSVKNNMPPAASIIANSCPSFSPEVIRSYCESGNETRKTNRGPHSPSQMRQDLENLEDASARKEADDRSLKQVNSVKRNMAPSSHMTTISGPFSSTEATRSSREYGDETRKMDRWPSSPDQRRHNLVNSDDASARKEADNGSSIPVNSVKKNMPPVSSMTASSTEATCSSCEFGNETRKTHRGPHSPSQMRQDLENLENASARKEADDRSLKQVNSDKKNMAPASHMTAISGSSSSTEATRSSREYGDEIRKMDKWPSSPDQRRHNLVNPEDASAKKEADDGSSIPVNSVKKNMPPLSSMTASSTENSFYEFGDEPHSPDQRKQDLVNLEDASARKRVSPIKKNMPPAFLVFANSGPSSSTEATCSSHAYVDETRKIYRWLSLPDQRRHNLVNPEDASARKEADDGSSIPVNLVKKNMPSAFSMTANSGPSSSTEATCISHELDGGIRKTNRKPHSPDQRSLVNLEGASSRKKADDERLQQGSSFKKNVLPAFLMTANSGPSSSTEANDQNLPPVGVNVYRTLPGLIGDIMSKGRLTSYEEIFNAVLQHWHILRNHLGEAYPYSSLSQAVRECTKSQSAAQLVHCNPEISLNNLVNPEDASARKEVDYGSSIPVNSAKKNMPPAFSTTANSGPSSSTEATHSSHELGDGTIKKNRRPHSPDQRRQDLVNLEDASAKKEADNRLLKQVNSVKKNMPPAFLMTANNGPSSSTEANGQNLPPVGFHVYRTLPDLIGEIMSRGKLTSYKEIFNAVLQHWHILRNHLGEPYSYSSLTQAVHKCMKSQSAAKLVHCNPKVSRKGQTDVPKDGSHSSGEFVDDRRPWLHSRPVLINPEDISVRKEAVVPPAFSESANSGSPPSIEAFGQDLPGTLPGLIAKFFSKPKHMTYDELFDAVQPHWDNLRNHNGEPYAYSSHSEAVLDCLKNRSEWAAWVHHDSEMEEERYANLSAEEKQKRDEEISRRGEVNKDKDSLPMPIQTERKELNVEYLRRGRTISAEEEQKKIEMRNKRRREKYANMSAEEKQKILELRNKRYKEKYAQQWLPRRREKYANLSPEEKQKISQEIQKNKQKRKGKYALLTPEEKQKMARRNLERWKKERAAKLSHGEKVKARKRKRRERMASKEKQKKSENVRRSSRLKNSNNTCEEQLGKQKEVGKNSISSTEKQKKIKIAERSRRSKSSNSNHEEQVEGTNEMEKSCVSSEEKQKKTKNVRRSGRLRNSNSNYEEQVEVTKQKENDGISVEEKEKQNGDNNHEEQVEANVNKNKDCTSSEEEQKKTENIRSSGRFQDSSSNYEEQMEATKQKEKDGITSEEREQPNGDNTHEEQVEVEKQKEKDYEERENKISNVRRSGRLRTGNNDTHEEQVEVKKQKAKDVIHFEEKEKKTENLRRSGRLKNISQ